MGKNFRIAILLSVLEQIYAGAVIDRVHRVTECLIGNES